MTTRLLVVCTANQCRSPLGEVIVAHAAGVAGIDIAVSSAGTRAVPGIGATERAVATAAKLGLDLSGHLSRPTTRELVAASDLIVAMERDHVLALVSEHGARFEATFTMPELATFAAAHPPRPPDETLGDWLTRIADGRTPASAMGTAGEIADPIGRSKRHYRVAATQITEASTAILTAGWLA